MLIDQSPWVCHYFASARICGVTEDVLIVPSSEGDQLAILKRFRAVGVNALEDLCETRRPFLCVSRVRVKMCRKLPSCIGSPNCARPGLD
jgi:hypothetical protein